MNIKATKRVYNRLLKDGELMDMFPSMTGSWESDKDDFMMMYNQNIELNSNLFDFDDDIDYNEYDY